MPTIQKRNASLDAAFRRSVQPSCAHPEATSAVTHLSFTWGKAAVHLCFQHSLVTHSSELCPAPVGCVVNSAVKQRTLDFFFFWQIIKLSSWIKAIQPRGFVGLCRMPAEAKNHVIAIATRTKKPCLPNTWLNASCHADRELVSLNFLKEGGRRLMRAVFIGATNVLPLVDSQHVSLRAG